MSVQKLHDEYTRWPSKRGLMDLYRALGVRGRTKLVPAAYARHQERMGSAENNDPLSVPLKHRYAQCILSTYIPVIRARGGETTIDGGDVVYRLQLMDGGTSLCLLHAEGWRYYTRREQRRARLSYLCGRDDSGYWAVRVAGTITRVTPALDWVQPARVRNALSAGKRVFRQGDMYVVESSRDNWRALRQSRHTWDPETRTLTHPEHAPLPVPFRACAVQQRVYEMGRSARFTAGD